MEHNMLFPGRANYMGPKTGWFAVVHHLTLYQEEPFDIDDRVCWIRRHAPIDEVSIRLHSLMWLGNCPAIAKRIDLDANYSSEYDALYAEYATGPAASYFDYERKRDALYAVYKVKRDVLDAEVLAYIRQHNPDFPWDGRSLVFGSALGETVTEDDRTLAWTTDDD